MKFILIAISLFVCSISFAQSGRRAPGRQPLGGSPNVISNANGFVTGDSGVIITGYTDTVLANGGRYIKMAHNVLIRVGNDLYARDTTTNSWKSVGGGIKKIRFNGDSSKYVIGNIGSDVDSVSSGIKTLIGLGRVTVKDSIGMVFIRFDTTGLSGGGSGGLLTDSVITSLPAIGEKYDPSLTGIGFIRAAYFKSQAPTASISGGGNFRLTSATSLAQTLNWTAGRLAKTNPLSSIIVASVSQMFTQPSAPGSVGGSQAVAVPTNTTTTYSITVTTTDGKTNTQSVTYAYFPERFWFYSTTGAPTSADVVADLGGGSELTSSKAKTAQFVVTISGTSKTVSYAYPSSYGALGSIIVSGLESKDAFHLNVVSVTNASGNVQNYNVYTSNNTFNAGSFTFTSVQ